jgi:hypothetical protein
MTMDEQPPDSIDLGDAVVDPGLLHMELIAAGIPVVGLGINDHYLTMHDADGQTIPPTPEAEVVIDKHDASKPKRTVAFETAEDVERLALINERAQTDPAFAALAELTLKEKQ